MTVWGTHRPQQEREARGYSWLWPGVPPTVQVVTVAPGTRSVYVTQQQPWHPSSSSWAGVSPSVIQRLFGNQVTMRQEQPYHPTPGTIIKWSVPPAPPPPTGNLAKGYIL